MPEASSRRSQRRRLVAITAAVACASAVGGVAAWLLLGSDGHAGTCDDLLGDKHLHTALGSGYRPGMSCSELGSAVEKAVVGAKPHRHSLQQAQTMKLVLVAVDESLSKNGRRVDAALRTPLAESLADYAPDTASVLGIGDADYAVRGLPAKPAWEDADGVHMAVTRSTLLRVLRGISEDPAAYATVRAASTRYAAEQLAAVPRGVTGYDLTVPPAQNSRVFGSLDAVATGVRHDLGDSQAEQWQRVVFTKATKQASTPPSYEKDPVGHLVDMWGSTLRAGGLKNSPDVLEQQSADMVDAWSRALKLTATVQNSLHENALNDSFHARSDALRELS
ncbi:hypothetical protein LK07_19420 [Streptomyces pluripotens]|uniref:Uncharacterized protein n=1 Tax=Streptomyces pluripotens TaxID=1355015 RepID=A0A221P209_9ACTN|nr:MULTISPECIES: hypothetical protein [Streptomyces]ARP71564.1 hypothetical protein LK06_018260 [Streptomyces pluripotens]ASN25815.1 hypothetical protein LK07_19420 [Streptomyces pluripotens]KIE25122.1 hypothetical protein LK08_21650 [Streptomyces sp. MUSC 125]